MRANYYKHFFGVLAFSMILALGAGFSVSAQKGHGKGRGGDGERHGRGSERGDRGDRGERRGGDNEGRGDDGDRGRGGWKRREMGGWQVQQPQQQQVWRQAERRRDDDGDRGGRGNGNGKWKRDRGGEQRVFNFPQQSPWGGGWVPPGQLRRQEVHARNDERKAWKDREKSLRKERKERYNDDRREFRSDRQSFERPLENNGVTRWLDRGRRLAQGYSDDRRVQYGEQQYAPVYEDRQNYRDSRRNRPVRTYDPSFGQYGGYDPNYYQGPVSSRYYNDAPGLYAYDDNYYGTDADSGTSGSWKQQILRTLISGVLGSFLGGNGNGFDQQFDPYSAGLGGYRQPFAYQPSRYNDPSSYYGGFSPQYAGYDQSYMPYSPYGQTISGFDLSMGGGLLNSIPLAGLLGQSGGGGNYITQMLTQVLAQGYVQGLLAGENAREQGYGEEAYYDPYVSQEGIYDPYSTSIGENRRLMSEGYDLGYQDALDGRAQFDPQSVVPVDLVSLLLGNVLSLSN